MNSPKSAPKLKHNSKLRAHIPNAIRAQTNRETSFIKKELMNSYGYKIVFQPSSPYKYRAVVFIPEINMSIDAFGNDKIVLAAELSKRADKLKITVPTRRALFARIDKQIALHFKDRREGILFIGKLVKNWQSEATTEQLAEIANSFTSFDSFLFSKTEAA